MNDIARPRPPARSLSFAPVQRRLETIVFVAAILFSFIAHYALLEGLSSAARKAPRKQWRPLEVAVIKPPPPPVVEAPKEEKKKVPPPPPPEPLKIEKPVEAPPPPNADAPPSTEPPKPVFGVSMTSVVGPGSGAGFTVRVGNTLMKEQDDNFTPASEVKPYAPAAMPLYKVNEMPKRVGECQADYPAEAKSLGIEGRIRLEVEVLLDGQVGHVRVLTGLGHGLDEAAVGALKKCRFSPAKIAGQAVITKIQYTYTFVLES